VKALVLEENGRLVYRDVPTPPIRDGEALVRVLSVGMCSSDLPRSFEGGSYRYPHILGHEIFGALDTGEHVAVYPMISCLACGSCIAGRPNCCKQYDYIGSRRDGGCAEYVMVPKKNLVPAPPELDPILGALTEPTAVTIHAYRRAESSPTDRVLIIGDGSMSVILAAYLKQSRYAEVSVLGKHPHRLGYLASFGADILQSQSDRLSAFDVVFEMAGTDSAYEAAIESARPHGTIVFVGNIHGDLHLPQKIFSNILRKELRLRGSWNSLYPDWHDAIDFLSGMPSLRSIVSHAIPMQEAPDVLRDAHARVLPNHMKIVLTAPSVC
jgi:threonine dehydrogenase-like Zn-dependent dehydrogenase